MHIGWATAGAVHFLMEAVGVLDLLDQIEKLVPCNSGLCDYFQ